jgi:hypothetical protein
MNLPPTGSSDNSLIPDPPSFQENAPEDRRLPNLSRLIWHGKIGPAFWTIASIISLAVNIILVVVLILVGKQLFALKGLVANQLVGGLYENFVLMDQARISTTVQVDDTIPVKFDLPVVTNTTVQLTENTRIRGATVNLSTGGLTIRRAPADIVLPAGTSLPIALNIVVPVDTTVPVHLTVPVDIPLNQTELHKPFAGLLNVVAPYSKLLGSAPDSWQETPLCVPWTDWVCGWLINSK